MFQCLYFPPLPLLKKYFGYWQLDELIVIVALKKSNADVRVENKVSWTLQCYKYLQATNKCS